MDSNDGALWLGSLLVLCGLVWALAAWQSNAPFMRRALLIEATVVDIEYVRVPRRGGGMRKEPWILFEFPDPFTAGAVGGGKLPDDRHAYAIGDRLKLYWDSQRAEFRFISIRHAHFYGLGMLAVGILLLLYHFTHLRHSPPDGENYSI